ncbi:MAG: hypothetical protein RLZZ283_562 [Candidatus Parcubacteria bacterium]
MDLFLIIFFGFLGLLVGSFINVVVLRYGYTESANPRSECMQCSATLAWYDLVPVLSYIVLRARCRACGSRLLAQYPLVELGTAALFALTATQVVSFSPVAVLQLLSELAFWSGLVALTAYDIRHTLIPYSFLGFLLGAAVVHAALPLIVMFDVTMLGFVLGGALVPGLFLGAVVLITRGRGMGSGDAYLAGILGLFVGLPDSVAMLLFAIWIGTLWGLLLIFIKSSATLKTEIPFAPFLTLGTVIVVGMAHLGIDTYTWLADFLSLSSLLS